MDRVSAGCVGFGCVLVQLIMPFSCKLVEYEVTLEDLEWLARYKSGKLTEHVVEDFTEDGLERMLDLMEKATARNFPISQVTSVV